MDALKQSIQQRLGWTPRIPAHRERMERTIGEILFNLSQLARRLGVSAEDSLRACNKRFVAHFRDMDSQ